MTEKSASIIDSYFALLFLFINIKHMIHISIVDYSICMSTTSKHVFDSQIH